MELKKLIKRMNWQERNKQLHAMVSDELKQRYGISSARIRKGDTVKIMRGDFKGVQGKVIMIYPTQARIAIEGVVRKKVNGQEVPVKIHASKVMITAFDTSDKSRFEEVSSNG